MCEERGGSVACDATFGTDPLVMRADLIESHERLFFRIQPSGQNILICCCCTWSNGNLPDRKMPISLKKIAILLYFERPSNKHNFFFCRHFNKIN